MSAASPAMRADARRNRERVLEAARAVFAEDGPRASLNRIAQRARVGAGTLYRHFPSSEALLVAIIAGDVEILCAQGEDLLKAPSPRAALRAWLGLVAAHATSMRGLVAERMASLPPEEGSPLAGCHDAIRKVTSALLARARTAGDTPAAVDADDLLRLANAIAWASEQASTDPGLLDRLLALVDL